MIQMFPWHASADRNAVQTEVERMERIGEASLASFRDPRASEAKRRRLHERYLRRFKRVFPERFRP